MIKDSNSSRPKSKKRESKKRRVDKNLARVGQALNHDFCPQLNKFVYWLKEPIGWVISAALISAVVGVYIGPQGFLVMWTALAFLILGIAWPWLCMKGLSCSLEFDESRAVEDRAINPKLKIVNRWPIPVFGLTVEGPFLQDSSKDDADVAVGLQKLSPISVSKFDWEITPENRGILPGGEVNLVTGFPFGLYQSSKKIQVNQTVIVHPKCANLETTTGLSGQVVNIRGALTDRSGKHGDIIGVRQFQRGDSLRDIHWSQTARHNRLIVRERQISTQPKILVGIDLGSTNQMNPGSDSSFEWSIRIAASICGTFNEYQAKVDLLCIGLGDAFAELKSNARGLNTIFDFLAMLPSSSELKNDPSFSNKSNITTLCDLAGNYQQCFLVRSSKGRASDNPLIKEFIVNQASLWSELNETEFNAEPERQVSISYESKKETFAAIKQVWERVNGYESRSA